MFLEAQLQSHRHVSQEIVYTSTRDTTDDKAAKTKEKAHSSWGTGGTFFFCQVNSYLVIYCDLSDCFRSYPP